MDLRTVVDSVKDLSPTPKILPKLQGLLRDPESDIEDVISLIKMDAPLTAQIVRMSNTTAFAFTAPSKDLEGAVRCLGFQEVYKVVGIVATGQTLGRAAPVYKMETGELWENSLRTAVLMEMFSKEARLDPNSAYTLGLLHSLGKAVINSYYLEKGIEIYSDEDGENIIPDLERQLIGFDHAQASSELLKKWAFPEESFIPIEHYPEPLKCPQYKSISCLLHMAVVAARALKTAEIDQEAEGKLELDIDPEIIATSGLNEYAFNEALFEAKEALKSVEEILAA